MRLLGWWWWGGFPSLKISARDEPSVRGTISVRRKAIILFLLNAINVYVNLLVIEADMTSNGS